MICSICTKQISKYKCPRCLVKYCSVFCYKNHKENCEVVSGDGVKRRDERIADAGKESGGERLVDESEDRVSQEALDRLGDTEELKQLLRNRHLRDMLRNLDASTCAEKDLERAMREPIFTEFVDQCLDIVEPKQSAET